MCTFLKLARGLILLLLVVAISRPSTVTVYAADGVEPEIEEESWWDKTKKAGSNAVDWVKEKTPAVKEKAGEVWDKAKERVHKAQEDFKEWNRAQEDEFWERTDQPSQKEQEEQGVQEPDQSSEITPEEERSAEPETVESSQEMESSIEDLDADDPGEAVPSSQDMGQADESEKSNQTVDEPKDGNRPDGESSKKWPLPIVILAIALVAGIGICAYHWWAEWYDDPDRP